MDEELENTDKQEGNKVDKRLASLLPYQWKAGQSGNPAGRPKGKTMKEYAKELLECQTEDERQAFLNGLPKDVIWKMAEGNPDNKGEIKQELTVMPVLVKFIDKNEADNSGNTK